MQLYSDAKEAFVSLSSTADPALTEKWRLDADIAKSRRQHDVKAMDYFQVAEFPGRLLETLYGLPVLTSIRIQPQVVHRCNCI